MRVVCVDDEKIALKNILLSLEEIESVTEKEGFTNPLKCLEYLKEHKADVAFLDIHMREMNGLEMAKQVKDIDSDISIIFLTGYSEYAVEAFKQHVSGYLLKPAGVDEIRKELEYVKKDQVTELKKGVVMQTFGNFEVFYDGKPIHFSRSKSKEILAYLVDRKGAGVTMSELASIIWEDGMYDRSRQKQMQTFVSEMGKALKSVGAEDIIIKNRTGIAIDKGKIECDYYAFLEGDVKAVNGYSGEYMSNYYWGEFTVGYLDSQKDY
ncbi:two-component system LytT family response regulator [Aequitasia blattaphilus]|uniref:Stage 0 sporulation protein A homolog n=1 Tax=Aequitasia blattaphilus TaxID=2949332 RepID=A0ABT1EAS2_9FIRM|nr:response regulator [Aequitasia blattaphilus]MCP1102047.1 response regulator [Aequitasia blattaphilus]MCR8614687.1 response regulator [Aequitasia blattaphilus]